MDIKSIVSVVVALVWVATAAVVFFFVFRITRGRPVKSWVLISAIMVVIAIVLSVVNQGLVFIKGEERGVVVSALAPNGYRAEPLTGGLNWVVPFFESVEKYSVAKQTYTMSIAAFEGDIQGDDSIAARTADGQEIYVDASVIYYLDPLKIVTTHLEWQGRITEGMVRPQVRGIIRDAVSQFGVEEIISTKRFDLTKMISDELTEKFEMNGVIMVDFVLRNIAFTEGYAESVEQKQIAEQMAQQAALTVEQKKQEAEQARQEAQGLADAVVIAAKGQAEARLIEAEAEAEALRVQAEVLAQYPELMTYVYITKLSPNIQVMLLPSDNPFLFPLPQMQGPTQEENSGAYSGNGADSGETVTP